MRRIRRHLSYANVTATLALVLALGGVGYAAIRIGPKQIKPSAVRGYHIKNGHVGGNNLGTLQEVIRVSQTRSATAVCPKGFRVISGDGASAALLTFSEAGATRLEGEIDRSRSQRPGPLPQADTGPAVLQVGWAAREVASASSASSL
jgi:hypothetical protein